MSNETKRHNSVGDFLLAASTISAWICGIVIAQGFASSLAAVIFPPWAWYLVAERVMQAAGWVQ